MLSEKGDAGRMQEQGRSSGKEGWRCQGDKEDERGLVRGKAVAPTLGLAVPR